jgi:hypothetical protein
MFEKRTSLSMVTLAVALVASCSCSGPLRGSSSSIGNATPDVHPAAAPVPGETLRKLPSGVFYFLAGSNPGSCNIWEVRNSGVVRQLTHNGQSGISAMSAGRQGIVAADAAQGADELAQVMSSGVRYLPLGRGEGHGETPDINDNGALAYMVPPYRNNYFELGYRQSFNAHARVFFRSHLPLSGPAWGPASRVAVVAERYATDTAKPKSWLFVINETNGSAHQMAAALTQFDYAVWGTHAPGIVISTWGGNAEYISQGHHILLPHGWAPLSWSPDGQELLVIRPNPGAAGEEIGLWDELRPRIVTNIGRVASGFVITEAAWLARPASLK